VETRSRNPGESEVYRATTEESYADLPKPIPDAVALLKEPGAMREIG